MIAFLVSLLAVASSPPAVKAAETQAPAGLNLTTLSSGNGCPQGTVSTSVWANGTVSPNLPFWSHEVSLVWSSFRLTENFVP